MAPARRGGDRFFVALGALLAGMLLAAPAVADDAAWARDFIADYLGEGLEDTRAAVALVDLNGDGLDEAIVYVIGSYWCGSGGCNAYVLTPEASDWAVVMETSVTQTPIGVLETSTNGWRDIFVSVGGGGIPGGRVVLRFDGTSYPDNPATVDADGGKAKGEVLIGDDDRGEPLQ